MKSESDENGTWTTDDIDFGKVEEAVFGTHTFENVPLYNPTLVERIAPDSYRTNVAEEGDESFPPQDVIINLLNKQDRKNNKKRVALSPQSRKMKKWKQQYDNGERSTCPVVVFDDFYCEQVVGSKSLEIAYDLVKNNDKYNCLFEVDYSNLTVEITVEYM